MHRAFEATTVVSKLPLTITALATWGDRFIVCVTGSQGENHLLLYRYRYSGDQRKYEADLERTFKKFSTKPITQVALVAEKNLIFMLADGEVLVVNLEYFQVMERLPRSKGVTCFAVDWQTLRSGGKGGYLRICVAAKKKLLFYALKDRSFVTLQPELSFPHTPVGIAWNANSLIACMKKDQLFYYRVTLDGNVKELFTIGSVRSEPEMLPLMDDKILVLKDEVQVILDEHARPTQSHVTNWSEPPNGIILSHPFLIALLPKCIEVRALDRKLLLQSIPDVKDTKYHASGKHVFVANGHNVFKLTPVPYELQVQQLVQQQQYELAMQICELVEESPEENKYRMREIQRLQAFYLFAQHNFEKSLEIYTKIDADPVEVIGLYKGLLPSEFQSSLSNLHPTEPPPLEGEALIRATKCLIDFLNQVRFSKGDDSMPSEEIRAQLIDTTLLKCYVKINSPLINSFIRLRGSTIHLAESERVLSKHDRFMELVELYNVKGQHDKALKTLLDHSQDAYSPLAGIDHIINYLQGLGESGLQLIFEYSKWVFQKVENPMDALKIFTEDLQEVESLPRQKVLEHLKKNAYGLVVPYLEHVVHHWTDPTSVFHNYLVKSYKDRVEKLLKQYRHTMAGKAQAKAGQEPGELGKVRKKLLHFLETSRHYVPAELISSFPSDDLFEERALLLCRLGRHEVALAIYAHVMKEPEMAEEYCRKNYDMDKEDSREVYLSLIKMYLSPPNMNDYGISLPGGVKPEPNVNAALRVLTTHHDLIDTVKVLDLLPKQTSIKNIKNFLTIVCQEKHVVRKQNHVLRSLFFAEHLQVQQQRITSQRPRCVVTEDTLCASCKKRFTETSAIARYPTGEVEHYFCWKGKDREQKKDDTSPDQLL